MSTAELERLLEEQRDTRGEIKELQASVAQLQATMQEYAMQRSANQVDLPQESSELSALESRLEEIAHNLRERITQVDSSLMRVEKRLEERPLTALPDSGPREFSADSMPETSASFEERFEQAQDFSIFNDIDLRIDELKDFLDRRTARWRLHENIFYGLVVLLLFFSVFFSWWAAFLR